MGGCCRQRYCQLMLTVTVMQKAASFPRTSRGSNSHCCIASVIALFECWKRGDELHLANRPDMSDLAGIVDQDFANPDAASNRSGTLLRVFRRHVPKLPGCAQRGDRYGARDNQLFCPVCRRRWSGLPGGRQFTAQM
jgi:hypothetical protein